MSMYFYFDKEAWNLNKEEKSFEFWIAIRAIVMYEAEEATAYIVVRYDAADLVC